MKEELSYASARLMIQQRVRRIENPIHLEEQGTPQPGACRQQLKLGREAKVSSRLAPINKQPMLLT